MHKFILKMSDIKKLDIKTKMNLPMYSDCAIICSQTEFVLDLLETKYRGVFKYIVILCPTMQWNKAYKGRPCIGDVRKPKSKNIIINNPIFNDKEKHQELLRLFFNKYAGSLTLYIIDDCSATK